MGLVCGLRWHALVLVDEARATLHTHVADAGDVQADCFSVNITLRARKKLHWFDAVVRLSVELK